MKFRVLSREDARRYTYDIHGHKYVIISISDMKDDANKFNHASELVDVLRLWFDDEEKGHPNCITKDDARKIIEFMNKHINDVDECVVHCGAGISRSAGVAAALMYIINGSDSEIFDSAVFCPNMTCYRMVLEAYFGSYDEVEVDRKYAHFIEIFRKANDLD